MELPRSPTLALIHLLTPGCAFLHAFAQTVSSAWNALPTSLPIQNLLPAKPSEDVAFLGGSPGAESDSAAARPVCPSLPRTDCILPGIAGSAELAAWNHG